MKILYHHRIRSKDGQYVHVEELTRALAQLGHEIIFVGPRAIHTEDFGAEAGIVGWMKARLPGFVYELLELSYALVDFSKMVSAILRHKPDCIYERYNLYLPSGIWAKKLFDLPLLLEVNAPLFAERARHDGISLPRLARFVERYTWRNADRVLPVTRVLAGMVEEAGVDATRIRVIPNAIDPARFSAAQLREGAKTSLGLEGKTVLGFTGFVRSWHGLSRVVEYLADRENSDVVLFIVGDGPACEALRAGASALGVANQLKITGVVDRSDVANYVSAFDVALQPNVVPYASPLKLFEYLALELAILAPATPNILEILEDGKNALLFDPGDQFGFAERLDELINKPDLRSHLGEAAGRTITESRLTWADNAEVVCQLFSTLGVAGSSTMLATEAK